MKAHYDARLSALVCILASNSVAFCTYPFSFETMNFAGGLRPWKHFVPVAYDGSDLMKKYQWCVQHDDACHQISLRAKQYIAPFLNTTIFRLVWKRWANLWDLRASNVVP